MARRRRPPPPGFLHIYSWSRLLNDYMCLMCKGLHFMHAEYSCDHGYDCPGWVEPVPLNMELPGTPVPNPSERAYWDARNPRVSQR